MTKLAMRCIAFIILLYSTDAKLLSEDDLNTAWNDFIASYDGLSTNDQHRDHRKNIFSQNLQNIQTHNERYRQGLETYELGVNKFSSYTVDELLISLTGLLQSPEEPSRRIVSNISTDFKSSPPKSFDWQSRNGLTPVRDQGNCGSCWAFCTIGAVEAFHKISSGNTTDLSEQELLDCEPRSQGCDAGFLSAAYEYMQNKGVSYDEDYQYRAIKSSCKSDPTAPKMKIRGFESSHTELSVTVLKNVIAKKGPVCAEITATKNFIWYKRGIFTDKTCTKNSRNHAVIIAGYGAKNGTRYFLVKNSWGTSWGQEGYALIAEETAVKCGIAISVTLPIL